MTNQPTKFEVPGPKRSSYWSETVFQLKVTLTLTFDRPTSKSIGFICWSWPTSLPSLRSLGPSVLKLLIGNRFSAKGHTDLDLWPTDLKINRVHLLVMTNQPTKFEVPGPKRSQVIDRKPFGLPTDRPTCAKQYTPLLSEGGIITNYIGLDVIKNSVDQGQLTLSMYNFWQCNILWFNDWMSDARDTTNVFHIKVIALVHFCIC